MRPGSATLASELDPHRNALNAVRLGLALLVVVWHSLIACGIRLEGQRPLRQFVGDLSVDAFFAISGFLITRSWLRHPSVRVYLRARAARILPAFWVSLLLTAFVVAPLALLLTGTARPAGYWPAAVRYVGSNAALWVRHYDIAGTPWAGGQWNSPMWTLWWEAACYVAVMVLGLVGLLRFRLVSLGLFLACLALTVVHTTVFALPVPYVDNALRFGLMFLAGQVLCQLRDVVPVTRAVLVGAAVLYLGSLFLPDYRVVGALPLAYLVLVLGAKGRARRLQFRNDLSYGTYIFAHPFQVTLSLAGATSLGVGIFTVLCIAAALPVAALSWFLVERPSLRWAKRIRSQRTTPTGAGRPTVTATGGS